MFKLVKNTRIESMNNSVESLKLENVTLQQQLVVKEKELENYKVRVNNQSEVISKIITIGKSKEQKASRNFNKVIENINSDTAKTFLFRKLVSSCQDKELLLNWKEIINNSIPE